MYLFLYIFHCESLSLCFDILLHNEYVISPLILVNAIRDIITKIRVLIDENINVISLYLYITFPIINIVEKNNPNINGIIFSFIIFI